MTEAKSPVLSDFTRIRSEPRSSDEFGPVIFSFMDIASEDDRRWYIGTAADIDHRLFEVHRLAKDDIYIARRAKSAEDAAQFARWLRQGTHDCDGWFGDFDPAADYFYAYQITETTRERLSPPASDSQPGVIVIDLRQFYAHNLHVVDDAVADLTTEQLAARVRGDDSDGFDAWVRMGREYLAQEGFELRFEDGDHARSIARYEGDPARRWEGNRLIERLRFSYSSWCDYMAKAGQAWPPVADRVSGTAGLRE